MNSNKPSFFILIYNISKLKNIGTLIRSANAFGVKQIFILGENKKILKKFFGSQGTVNKSDFLFFDDVSQLRIYCQEKSINIVGIEIGEGSKPINEFEFKGDTLFVLGNEGQGMNTKQKELCKNSLVYIPQFSNKTASLNVACAGSIIFHYFSTWAKYDEMNIVDEKFEVDNSIVKNVSIVKELSSLNIEDESV